MKFVVNTKYNAAGTIILNGLIRRLKESGYSVDRNNWNTYQGYNIAIFMAPDSEVSRAKKNNPKIIVGIFDPKTKTKKQRDEVRCADFIVVSSIEQRETFLQYNKNIFIYYMFPDIISSVMKHEKKEKITIGYHGNKQHLDSMRDVSLALDEISKNKNIEFTAIYNIKKLGKWKLNTPKHCKVNHVQWSEDDFVEVLKKCDIGIVPSLTPVPVWVRILGRPFRSFIFNNEGYHSNDHMIRFKYSNNPGRLYVFSQLEIPVVTEFTPSSSQIIEDGKSGFLVGGKEGWKSALLRLIDEHTLRQSISQALRVRIEESFSPDETFKKFIIFLGTIHAK